jgi:uncharacterized membrane protein
MTNILDWLSAARVSAGLLLVFVLPGYALTFALFPRHTLDAPERTAFSIGLSLVIAAFGGLLLNATPSGINPLSWAILLVAVAALAGVVTFLRQRRMPTDPVRLRWSRMARSQAILFGLAAVIALTAVTLSYADARHQPSPGFTQLWLLPAGGDTPTLRIGVESHEPVAIQYRLQLAVDGQVALEWPSVTLQPNERWETTAALPANVSSIGTIEAILFRADRPDAVYRRAVLTP